MKKEDFYGKIKEKLRQHNFNDHDIGIVELDSHASAGHHQRNENRVPSGV